MNAIILAAGKGSRLMPLTIDIPKPLLQVCGLPIIEKQILFLNAAGIKDIFIVVGYRHKEFYYLREKFGVHLIYNSHYGDINNIYSLFLARVHLSSTFIIEGDLFLIRNIFESVSAFNESFYFTAKTKDFAHEWIIDFDRFQFVRQFITPGQKRDRGFYRNGAYILTGISFWNENDSSVLRKLLEKEVAGIFSNGSGVSLCYYWDDVVRLNLNQFDLKVNIIESNDCFEIDSEPDLKKLVSYVREYSVLNKIKTK